MIRLILSIVLLPLVDGLIKRGNSFKYYLQSSFD